MAKLFGPIDPEL